MIPEYKEWLIMLKKKYPERYKKIVKASASWPKKNNPYLKTLKEL